MENTAVDLYKSALSLLIHKQGCVSDGDVDDLLERYKKKRSIVIAKGDYLQALSEAKQHYFGTTVCLFVCSEGACAERAYIGAEGPSPALMQEKLGCPVEMTGCHWQCELAPVVTLKIDSRQVCYADCSSAQSVDGLLLAVQAELVG